MGCSSSSAQTVDQEKRPGTKPEETSGDTLAVKNGIIAEDAQPIEDQLQLPGQTAPPHEAKAGAVNEEEAVLVAMEAQEDLGSGEDLLAAPEPQPETAACEEQMPSPVNSSAVEGSAEPEADVAEAEPAQAVQEEASDLVEEVVAEPAVEPDIPEPTMTLLVVEETPAEAAAETPAEEAAAAEAPAEAAAASEAPAEEAAAAEAPAEAAAASEAPAEEASSVQAEEPTDHPAPEAPTENEPSEPSAADEASTSGVVSAPNEDAEPSELSEPSEPSELSEPSEPSELSEPSEPAGVVEPFINTAIAEATIPELPSSSAQNEPEPVSGEATKVSTAPSETAPPEEVLRSTEFTHTAEQVQTLEVPVPAPTASETLSQAEAEAPPEGGTSSTAGALVVEITLGQSEGPSAPKPALEPSPEVVSTNEASQDSERQTAQKD